MIKPEDQIPQVVEIIKNHFPEFIIDSRNEKIIHALILYFFDNPEFEKLDWIKNPSLQKGLRFSGNVGTGKSKTLELFSNLSRNFPVWSANRFGLFSCRQVIREYKENEVVVDLHGVRSYKKEPFEDEKRPITKAFDGFGEEIQRGPVMVYGNRVNVMQEILMDRYEEFLRKGMKTHITTNLTLDEVGELYSTMLADRFKQMFNNIVFIGDSMRK